MQKYMYKVDNRWNTSLYTNMNLQASNKPEKIFWIKTCIVLQEKKSIWEFCVTFFESTINFHS